MDPTLYLLPIAYCFLGLALSYAITESKLKIKNKTTKEKLDLQLMHIITIVFWLPIVVLAVFSPIAKL